MASNGTSKFLALILRHKPEVIGITLDEHGWANVDEVIAGIRQRQTAFFWSRLWIFTIAFVSYRCIRKTGLYLNPADGKWYLPHGTAPSTHIVKQSHVRLKNIVANEMLCLHTARKLGMDVPEFFMVPSQETEPPLYAVRRYDREYG